MIQFMRCRNQIDFFVRIKANRGLQCLQYDPYVYHVVYQWTYAFAFDLLVRFTVDNGRGLSKDRENR